MSSNTQAYVDKWKYDNVSKSVHLSLHDDETSFDMSVHYNVGTNVWDLECVFPMFPVDKYIRNNDCRFKEFIETCNVLMPGACVVEDNAIVMMSVWRYEDDIDSEDKDNYERIQRFINSANAAHFVGQCIEFYCVLNEFFYNNADPYHILELFLSEIEGSA